MNDLNQHETIMAMLPAYALGSLEGDERRLVERHLRNCPDCQVELAGYERVVAALGTAVSRQPLSPNLEHKLLARIAPQPKPSFWAWRIPRWQLAVALLLLFVVVITAVRLWPTSPAPFLLTPTDAAPAASGELRQQNDDAVLAVIGLPPLPADQQYQLWLIVDGERSSGAVFSVNAEGEATVTVVAKRPLIDYDAFGITIEPAGGSPGPTGERVLGYNL